MASASPPQVSLLDSVYFYPIYDDLAKAETDLRKARGDGAAHGMPGTLGFCDKNLGV